MLTDYVHAGLVGHVHARSLAVIESELRRLSRRNPALQDRDLDLIDDALRDIAETLILRRLRAAPPDRAALLRRLFDYRTLDT